MVVATFILLSFRLLPVGTSVCDTKALLLSPVDLARAGVLAPPAQFFRFVIPSLPLGMDATPFFAFAPAFESVLSITIVTASDTTSDTAAAIVIAIDLVKAIVTVIDLGVVIDEEIAIVVRRVAESSGIARGVFALEWGFTTHQVRGTPAGGGLMPSIFIGAHLLTFPAAEIILLWPRDKLKLKSIGGGFCARGVSRQDKQ